MFFPYKVETELKRFPIANFLVIAVCVIIYLSVGAPKPRWITPFERMAPFQARDVFTHMWFHAGLFHLIANMLFLWVFGNAVCARLGNVAYAFVYVGLGIFAGLAHWLFDGSPVIGASGAICGVVGIFLIWFPKARVTCLWWLLTIRSFRISSIWLIMLWFVFDIIGLLGGGSNVAHWAHIGGYVAGFATGYVLLQCNLVAIGPNEETLLRILSGRRARRPAPPRADVPSRGITSPRPRGIVPMAPPDDYFVTLRCRCGAEVRRPRTAAGDRIVCDKCGAVIERTPPGGM